MKSLLRLLIPLHLVVAGAAAALAAEPGTGKSFQGPVGLQLYSLRAQFAAAGITSAQGVVAYCGSGVNACHTLLVMEHAGLGRGRLFPGSWSAWSNRADRPVATVD